MYYKHLFQEKTYFNLIGKSREKLRIDHLEISFRVKNSTEGPLLLILNLCLLEKLTGSSFTLRKQKKNIRTFSPVGSIIGGSLIVDKNFDFMKYLLHFYLSRKNIVLLMKKKNSLINSLEFSLDNFLNLYLFKLNRNNWETFTYLYDKQIYGLDISLRFNTRIFSLIKLYLSILGVYLLEI